MEGITPLSAKKVNHILPGDAVQTLLNSSLEQSIYPAITSGIIWVIINGVEGTVEFSGVRFSWAIGFGPFSHPATGSMIGKTFKRAWILSWEISCSGGLYALWIKITIRIAPIRLKTNTRMSGSHGFIVSQSGGQVVGCARVFSILLTAIENAVDGKVKGRCALNKSQSVK